MDVSGKIREKGIRRLAAEVGVTAGHISLVAAGKRSPSVWVVMEMAKALKLDVADLLRHLEVQRRKSDMTEQKNSRTQRELEPEAA